MAGTGVRASRRQPGPRRLRRPAGRKLSLLTGSHGAREGRLVPPRRLSAGPLHGRDIRGNRLLLDARTCRRPAGPPNWSASGTCRSPSSSSRSCPRVFSTATSGQSRDTGKSQPRTWSPRTVLRDEPGNSTRSFPRVASTPASRTRHFAWRPRCTATRWFPARRPSGALPSPSSSPPFTGRTACRSRRPRKCSTS